MVYGPPGVVCPLFFESCAVRKLLCVSARFYVVVARFFSCACWAHSFVVLAWSHGSLYVLLLFSAASFFRGLSMSCPSTLGGGPPDPRAHTHKKKSV